MMLQLDPMLPVFVPRFNMEGFAFLVDRHSQEHYTIFTIAMDNGEIWELSNREVRFCKNHTMDRHEINKDAQSVFLDKFRPTSNTNGGSKKDGPLA